MNTLLSIQEFRTAHALLLCVHPEWDAADGWAYLLNRMSRQEPAWFYVERRLELFHAIVGGKNVEGAKIGHFTVRAVEPIVNPSFEDDKKVIIGCHAILLSEAKAVLGAL